MANAYLNASYSLFSYGVRRFTGINVTPPLPPAISVELSSRCTLSCPECITGTGQLTRKNPFMSHDLASEIASQVRGHAISAWLSFQGEPMMHPGFFTIAGLFAGMNPVISTNGHYLDRENCIRLAESPLQRIIVSYDGITPETYGIYRKGGNHQLVTEGIGRLAATLREKRSGPEIILQFLLHSRNEHEARAVAAFARSLGAGFRIKTMQVLDTTRAPVWMPSDRRKARYGGNESKQDIVSDCKKGMVSGSQDGMVSDRSSGTVSSRDSRGYGVVQRTGSRNTKGCLRMWTTAVITADGDVVPCCYDKNAEYSMGNLKSNSFAEIWKGEKYAAFRRSVMYDRRLTDICRDCPQGKKLFFRH